jgi:hypothetical protein
MIFFKPEIEFFLNLFDIAVLGRLEPMQTAIVPEGGGQDDY